MLSRLPLSFIVRLPVTIIARYRRLPRRAMGITEGMAEGNAPAPGPTETITFRDRDFFIPQNSSREGGVIITSKNQYLQQTIKNLPVLHI